MGLGSMFVEDKPSVQRRFLHPQLHCHILRGIFSLAYLSWQFILSFFIAEYFLSSISQALVFKALLFLLQKAQCLHCRKDSIYLLLVALGG